MSVPPASGYQLSEMVDKLPAECLLRIFDFLHPYTPTLLSAALVRRAWTAPAQASLFRRVDLHSAKQTQAYLAVSSSIRRKALVTRELELDLDRDGIGRGDLEAILRGLDSLSGLTMQTGLQTVPHEVLSDDRLAGESRGEWDAGRTRLTR